MPVINRQDLSEFSVDPDPFRQFSKWLNERILPVSEEPYTVVLATAGTEGRVSARIVLIKEIEKDGFVFFTNYNSRKGNQIVENPFGALLFHWPDMQRQVRVEGRFEKVSITKSAEYFENRPRQSQLSSWASEQSNIVPDRKYLEDRVAFFKNKFDKQLVPKPAEWGGYKLIPLWFEFWQERDHRLHDRIAYSISGDSWIINRLAP